MAVSHKSELIPYRSQPQSENSQIHQLAFSMPCWHLEEPSSPILRLPPELTVQIFLDATDIGKLQDRCKLPERLVISQVCRYWRAIALDCAALWSSIHLQYGNPCVSKLLARTKQHPLSLVTCKKFRKYNHILSPERSTMPILKRLLATEMWRIRDLDITTHNTITTVGKPSQLRSLTVRERENLQPFVKMIEGGETSELRKLWIHSHSFNWETMVHRNLTLLFIRMYSRHPDLEDTLKIIPALRSMPLLQALKLKFCLSCDLTPSESRDLISLPHLHTIDLASMVEGCVNLLSYLDLPAAQLVKLTMGNNHDTAPLAKINSNLPVYRSCTLGVRHGWGTVKLYAEYNDEDGGPEMSLTMDPVAMQSSDTCIELMSSYLPLSHVEKLTMCIDYSSREAMVAWFEKMPSLRVLRMEQNFTRSVLESLFLPNDVAGATSALDDIPSTYLPRLEVLAFELVDFENLQNMKTLADLYLDSVRRKLRGMKPSIKLDMVIYRLCDGVTPDLAVIMDDIVGGAYHGQTDEEDVLDVLLTVQNLDDVGFCGYDFAYGSDEDDEYSRKDCRVKLDIWPLL